MKMRTPTSLPKLLRTSTGREAEQSCLALLQACSTFQKLTLVQAHLLKSGLQNNPLVLTKFASTSSSLNAINYASLLLFSPETDTCLYDTFLFNTIVRAYAQTVDFKGRAVLMYNFMRGCGVLPNKFTYPFVLKACAGMGDLNLGKSVHGSVLKFGFDNDVHAQNTMVHMYCCCQGSDEMARKVFDEMPKEDSVTWGAMIGGYARLGMSADAIGLFRKMQTVGVRPDEITMISVLSACTDLGALELGKWIESYIEKEKVWKSVELCNAMIDMFAKCGDIARALKLFKNMNERTIVSWTSVIVGLAMHGRGFETVSLFEEMIRANVVPDFVVFIGLLSACSHSGLIDEGKNYFHSMTEKFGIEPKIEHYGCMVDLLCRAGLVKEALEFVQNMPFEPNQIILRTLTSACRAHGELKIGESIAEQLIRNDPMDGSSHVLLSNIYAKMLQWEKKSKIREEMDEQGMRKVPGSTMIEIGNEMYEFVAGDKTHKQHEEIYEMMDEMEREMKRAGYVASTSEVMLDVDEEEKEVALNQHSEKIAIAFALLNTPPGTPIRLVKNLKVCADCHSAIKFVSKIYDRELVVRDRNRFHHFKDGLCSCKDFW